MIKADIRTAIYCLHEQAMSIGQISRQLKINRRTVKKILSQQGVMPETFRKDRKVLDEEHIRELYKRCDGYAQRIHELLTEEGITLGYSTLTEKIRELGLGDQSTQRCSRVADEPGGEIQHDTSVYQVKIGLKEVKVIGSMLYFRYSKIRYLKFYRSFNRFAMKCFFHEALTYWGYCAPVCIIDNTNLARLHGSGKNAIIVPEMVKFSQQYGFSFVCHEISHANRKAGNERSFYTVETNFFPGRSFSSFEDLNVQALEWSTKKMAIRPMSKTGLIPAKAFEHEQLFLKKLPAFVQPPYMSHERKTDQYGFISFDGNFYWIPGTKRELLVVLQYSDCIRIYHHRTVVATYPMPAQGIKNSRITLPGYSSMLNQPIHRSRVDPEEEKKVRAIDDQVNKYLDAVLKQKGTQRNRFIRQLYSLYQKLGQPFFIQTIQRASKYRITDIETIESIARFHMRNAQYTVPLVELDLEVTQRDAYRAGCFSDTVDLSQYDSLLEDTDG